MHQTPEHIRRLAVGYNVQHNSSPHSTGMGTIQTLDTRASFSQDLWKDIKLTAALHKSFNWGYRGPANRDPFGVDLSLQGHLYKSHLTWNIAVQDLFDQRADQGRTVSRNQITDYYNHTRGRYVLAALHWRFGKFGGQW